MLYIESQRRVKRTSLTCSNPSCKKAFSSPLKTLNLQQDSGEPYAACPYCLTKIINVPIEIKHKSKKTNSEQSFQEEKPIQNIGRTPACNYHLGYLSEREKREQIPDECISCKNILDCMLKKMRQET